MPVKSLSEFIERNGEFWVYFNPSKIFDTLLENKFIVSTIKKIVNEKKLARFIEQEIIQSYTRLINTTLRSDISNMQQSDLQNPAGFIEAKKSSVNQLQYLNDYQALSDFIKHDILQHRKRISALSALNRWITIASRLYDIKCYDGMCLVISTLNTAEIGSLPLFNTLPLEQLEKFNILTDLISPVGNFSNFRKQIDIYQQDNCLPLINLMVRDLIYIDGQLDQIVLSPSGKLYADNPMMPILMKKIHTMNLISTLREHPAESLTTAEQLLLEFCQKNSEDQHNYYQMALVLKKRIKQKNGLKITPKNSTYSSLFSEPELKNESKLHIDATEDPSFSM